ncbi:MAG: hypothetical protein LBD06_11100 [Candidatus Accumulibacter sp.]|nr:hypothetical protein [Accumulibacter sp.]
MRRQKTGKFGRFAPGGLEKPNARDQRTECLRRQKTDEFGRFAPGGLEKPNARGQRTGA